MPDEGAWFASENGILCPSIIVFMAKNYEALRGMSHIQSVRWGVPVRETLVLSHRLCEVGWPVPSSPPLSLQCFHQVPICCWVDSERVFNHWLYLGLEPWSSQEVASALTAMLLAHMKPLLLFICHKLRHT